MYIITKKGGLIATPSLTQACLAQACQMLAD